MSGCSARMQLGDVTVDVFKFEIEPQLVARAIGVADMCVEYELCSHDPSTNDLIALLMACDEVPPRYICWDGMM